MGELPTEKKDKPYQTPSGNGGDLGESAGSVSSASGRHRGSDSVTQSFQPQELLQSLANSGEVLFGPASFDEQQKTVISNRPAATPQDFYRQTPLADLAEMLEGKMLDHFHVGQLIGGGGMGAVFRGVDKRLDRVVAIKVIPGSRRQPEMLRRFRLEAQAAARLDHPNIARVFYVGQAERWDYIVFEFIDGVNIRDLVDMEGPLSVDDAVFYTRQVAEALQHAHERAVVHRDIKPSNILVTASGVAKLVDMGLARDTSLDSSTQDQTASGITLGTFDYISPEQARNPRDADVRSDLYSLGCSLFFMLTGYPPFPDGTALQKLLNHGSLPPPDPRGWRDDISDELYQILMKLMAKRPADRYERPIDLVNDLLLLAQIDDLPRSQGPSTLSVHPTVAQPTLLESHLPWIVASLFLLGSTVWLQSQSLSSGFVLPSINFPDSNRSPLNPMASVSSSVTGSTDKPVDLFTEAVAAVAEGRRGAQELEPRNSIPASIEEEMGLRPVVSNARNANDGGSEAAIQEKTTGSDASGRGDVVVKGDSTLRSVLDASPLVSDTDVIVVSNIPPSDISAQNWESSLYRAVQRWISQPEKISAIEIRGSIWLDRPIEIRGAANIPSRLILRGAVNSDAKIEIARGVWSNLPAESGVIRLKDAGLAIEKIQVQSIFRENEMLARSVFQLTGNSYLEASQSTFTLECDRPNLAHLIFVGDVEENNDLGLTTMGQREARSIRVTMNRSLVRGTANVLRVKQMDASQKDSIQISVIDSLIAVGGKVLNMQSATGQSSVERMVRFFCEWSTFASSDGFASLEYLGASLPLVGFSRTSQSCVYWSRPTATHITLVGESANPQNNPDTLLLQGVNNAYDQNLQVLCQHLVGGVRMRDWESKEGQLEGWFAERGNDRIVRWRKAIPEMPVFPEASWADFELVPTHFVPGFRSTGLPSP